MSKGIPFASTKEIEPYFWTCCEKVVLQLQKKQHEQKSLTKEEEKFIDAFETLHFYLNQYN